MSVDNRHKMFQVIITNKKRTQRINETTHMRDSRKENNRLQMQQNRKQETPTKRKSRQAKQYFLAFKKQNLKHQMKKDVELF